MLKKNIRISKNWKSILWIVAVGGIVLIFLYSIERQLQTGIQQVKIRIEDRGDQKSLVTKAWVRKQLDKYLEGRLDEITLGHLDLAWLEKKLELDSRIENVEVYLDGRNAIHVDVTLKQPLVRIISHAGEKYYLDILGDQVELGDHVAIRVPIVTGYIDAFQEDWQLKDTHNLNKIFELADYISKDNFLDALIEQIHMDEDGMITVIPKIGRERIFVGTSQDLPFKMENLKLSYKYILKREGWGKFKELKLDIPNQVVALS